MATLSEIRNERKHTFNKYLNALNQSKLIRAPNDDKKGMHKLLPIRMEQINESHLIQSLNIMTYSFSCNGNCTLDQILKSSVLDQASIRQMQLEHAIETGTGMVLKGKDHRILSVFYFFDSLDKPVYDESSWTKKMKQREGILRKALRANHKASELMTSKEMGFGEVVDFQGTAPDPNVNGLGIGHLMTYSAIYMLLAMGYKYIIHEQVNPITIAFSLNTLRSSSKYHCLSHTIFDYAQFVEDELNGFDSHYLRKNAKIGIFISDFHRIREAQKLNGEEWIGFVLEMMADSHIKRSKL